MKSGVVPGRAGSALTVTTLPKGTHSLTAVFTPTNPAVYAQSTSAPVPLRVSQLTALVATANRHVDETCYQVAGQGLGAVLTELHVHAVSGGPDVRRAALAALAEACIVAAGIARPLGNGELSILAAKRATEAAGLTGRPELAGLTGMTRVGALVRLGARHRAGTVLTRELASAEPHADPSAPDTAAAEGYGMLHLSGAHLAAREGRAADADTHLTEARRLARATGERNAYRYHFGPANVAA